MERVLIGKNVILRGQRPEDAGYFTYWFNQPKVMFQCGFAEPCTEEETKKLITQDHRSEDSLWFTVTDKAGNIIGETGLLRMFPAWRQTDLTIIIPDPAMQRRGYGTEVMTLMLDLAFGEYEMHRVSIGVVGLNAPALAFYKKIGFKQEGILEDGYYYNGEYSDFIMMRILSGEWKSRAVPKDKLEYEEITEKNYEVARLIDRSDVSEDFVGGPDELTETLEYGRTHDCIGHAFAVSANGRYIATILLGDAMPWETDPPEVKARPFYRLMFFAVDKAYRCRGLGEAILEETVKRVCEDFGERPIVLGVHRDNVKAARFYERHGFVPTEYFEGNDRYYLRYPE